MKLTSYVEINMHIMYCYSLWYYTRAKVEHSQRMTTD